MKKRKLLFLLAMVTCLSVPLSACKDNDTVDNKEAAKHKMFNYFSSAIDEAEYSSVYKIDGEVIAADREHNLVAVKTSRIDTNNYVSESIQVYDISQGEGNGAICSTSCGNNYNSDPNGRSTISVNFDYYPLVQMVSNSPSLDSEGNWENNYYYTYYLAKPNSYNEQLSYSSDISTPQVQKYGNMYACKIGEDIIWVNKDLERLRKIPAVVANTYGSFPNFREYNDYLYVWEFGETNRKAQIFNKEGVCSVEYNFSNEMVTFKTEGGDMLFDHVFVLNNGNLLVQEWTLVDDAATEYDFKYNGYKCNVVNKIINYKTGEVSEAPAEFVVRSLESAYDYTAEDSEFPFALADGRQNQAYVSKFENGLLSSNVEYVVLNNEMATEYTFNNKTLDSIDEYRSIQRFGGYYAAGVEESGDGRAYLFDLDGKLKTVLPENTIGATDSYILTPYSVYNYNLKSVYDFSTSNFAGNADFECYTIGNEIFAETYNYQTGGTEIYKLTEGKKKKKQFTLIVDGVDTALLGTEEGYYTTEDEENETYTLYKIDGTALLKTQGEMDIQTCADALYVMAEVDGKPVCYVVL